MKTKLLDEISKNSNLINLEVFESFYTEIENEYGDLSIDLDTNSGNKAWFFWFCLPGYLPDSDGPIGPYSSETEALTSALEMFG